MLFTVNYTVIQSVCPMTSVKCTDGKGIIGDRVCGDIYIVMLSTKLIK